MLLTEFTADAETQRKRVARFKFFTDERLNEVIRRIEMTGDEQAARSGEAEAIERAEALLHQPSDSAPHDDHLHLRVHCASDDRALGCGDRPPMRWWKKRYKYMPPVVEPTASELLTASRTLRSSNGACWVFIQK